MFLTFHFWGAGKITGNLKISSGNGEWKKGIYCPSNTENINVSLGNFSFDPKGELLDAIKCIKTVDDLEYLNLCFKIPKQKILHIDNDKTFSRSEDMKLAGSGMAFSEQLKYYNLHKNDVKKTVAYHCKTKRDVILAQLHFYISNLGYKVQICKMCGKPFCVKNLKTQFCQNTGFDKERPLYSCNHIAALQRNNRCANETVKKKRKVIRETLKRKDEKENTNSLAEFDRRDEKIKSSVLPSEYEQWILEQHKIFVPNAEKRNNKQKSTF